MKSFTETFHEKLLAVVTGTALTLMVAACGTQAVASPPKSSGPEATAAAREAGEASEQRILLAEEVVRNGEFDLPGFGAFQLKDGNYQEKYGEGATQVKRAGVVTVAFGDLDADRVDDAAVVLWANTGGSGTFIYLAPIIIRDGSAQQAGSQLLGDRVQVKSLAIAAGKIRAEVLTQGPGDAMASPSLLSSQEYGLRGGSLTKLSPATSDTQPTPKPSPQPQPAPTQAPAPAQPTQGSSELSGTIWIWQRFIDNGEKDSFLLPFPAAYRLELLNDGTFLFQADCNQGRGAYTLQGSGLMLTPGPTTLAECQRGSRSSQYVAMLGHVASYVQRGDTLYLNQKMDAGDMVFSRLSSVTGTISGPAGDSVPAGSLVEVMIVNTAGAQIAGAIVKAALPMHFEAPFKPANIDPAAAYSLEVTFKDAQKNVIFKSSRPYRVLTEGNPTYHLSVEVQRVR